VFVQTITITNTSASALSGPLALVLTNLSSGVTLANASGTFNGNPYIDVLGSGGTLGVGKSISVVLQFSDPTLKSFTYGRQLWQNLS
jgi:hypothetical protein